MLTMREPVRITTEVPFPNIAEAFERIGVESGQYAFFVRYRGKDHNMPSLNQAGQKWNQWGQIHCVIVAKVWGEGRRTEAVFAGKWGAWQ